ncbi:hypothetical protein SAMN02745165_02266 [Malonomonas rubra DSM 5091]|uniref:Cytochrome c domain-containing protein n=1 Tax=Malonomonas rubra DSM 5091 TaxID=1122189 RepID=A0A1M6IW40_MALRU|nr:hypothetical protein [Malonomonas rubra]SHJ38648.1 hypothetical protein SAMN02745165_02266 [Malonomonas rubra DSM 5091]
MKRVVVSLIIFTFVASTAFAISGGNPYKGRVLFKKSCVPCHKMGTEAGTLSPSDKTMAQWDRYFNVKKRKHPGSVFVDLSQKDRLDIWQFVYDFAADTDHPQT